MTEAEMSSLRREVSDAVREMIEEETITIRNAEGWEKQVVLGMAERKLEGIIIPIEGEDISIRIRVDLL